MALSRTDCHVWLPQVTGEGQKQAPTTDLAGFQLPESIMTDTHLANSHRITLRLDPLCLACLSKWIANSSRTENAYYLYPHPLLQQRVNRILKPCLKKRTNNLISEFTIFWPCWKCFFWCIKSSAFNFSASQSSRYQVPPNPKASDYSSNRDCNTMLICCEISSVAISQPKIPWRAEKDEYINTVSL